MSGKSFDEIKAEAQHRAPSFALLAADPVDVTDLTKIHTYEDCETQVITLMQSRDKNSFAVGDTLRAFEVNRGHPLDEDATLTKIAGRAGCLPSQLSMWRAVSIFYPPEGRTFETLRWSHYYQAMMYSAGAYDNAVELLAYAADNDLSVNNFRNWLKKKDKGTPPSGQPADNGEDLSDVVTRTVTIADSGVWDDDYYGALREILPDDVKAGEVWEIVARRVR